MSFGSFSFLLYFLPFLAACYFCVPRRFLPARNLVLLLLSLGFCAWAGARFLPLMFLSAAVNYLGGLFAGEGKSRAVRRASLALTAAVDLGLLGWFKYAGFFAGTMAQLGLRVAVPEIALPIGISFYTFQGISYVADVYHGRVAPQRNPLNILFYLSFFPRLAAGPILRYGELGPSLERREESLAQVSDGLTRFCFGLGKKVLLADAVGQIANAVFPLSGPRLTVSAAWLGALAYTLQIYFDFSGYSDMAIGLGGMFGFHFPENFRYPYVARSVTDFWRRWHITLSSWFRDYVYIPLGGSRVSRAKCVRNLLIVWLLTGLWHGAAWTFVLWGAWFGVFLMGERYVWGGALKRAPRAVQHLYAMLLVVLSWVLFRSKTPAAALAYLGAMFGLGSGGLFSGETAYYLREYWPELLVCIPACLPVRDLLRGRLEAGRGRAAELTLLWGPKLLALALLLVCYMRLTAGSFSAFIYFQF